MTVRAPGRSGRLQEIVSPAGWAYGRVSDVQRRRLLTTACFFFLGTWFLLSATSSGHLFVADEICYYYMASSFADHGRFDVPSPRADVNVRQALVGQDGRYYAPYSFGHSLYLLPWAWVSGYAQKQLGTAWAPVFIFSFAHSLTTSLTWTIFLLILLDYGLTVRRTLMFTLASLFCTLAFPYARSLFAEPVLALFLVVSWLCLRLRGKRQRLYAICAGLGLAFAVAVRPSTAVLLPGFWLLAWAKPATPGDFGGNAVRDSHLRSWRLGLVAVISLTGIASFGLYNYLRFGSLVTSGYPPLPTGEAVGFSAPLWFGLAVFFISPGKAIWLFNPLLALSAIGWRHVWLKHRTTAIFIGWLFAVNLGLHSVWCQPEGGTCWGPRFFVGLLPMLLLPAALFWANNNSRNVRLAFSTLVVLGVLVQILGVAVNYSGVIAFETMVPKWASKGLYCVKPGVYNLAFSPFPAHIQKLREIAAGGDLLAPRSEAVRLASNRSATHSFPFWFDTLDIWAIHLVKDGYPARSVLAIEAMLVLLGLVSVLLAFRMAPTDRQEDGRPPVRPADPVELASPR